MALFYRVLKEFLKKNAKNQCLPELNQPYLTRVLRAVKLIFVKKQR